MKVEITLQRMNNFFTLEYSGVKNVLQLNGKVIVDLYKDYSQQDRNQDQFQEDGEDLEDPIGYL